VTQTEWIPRDEGDDYLQSSLNKANPNSGIKEIKRNYTFQMNDRSDDYENYFEGGE